MEILKKRLLRKQLNKEDSQLALSLLSTPESLVAKKFLQVVGVPTDGLSMEEMVGLMKQAREEKVEYSEEKAIQLQEVESEMQVRSNLWLINSRAF